MTVLPKEIDNATTWAFFERYESINKFDAQTQKQTLVYFAICVFGIGYNLGTFSKIEVEMFGTTTTIANTPVFAIIVFAAAFVMFWVIAAREKLSNLYNENLFTYFEFVEPEEHAKFTANFVTWRSGQDPSAARQPNKVVRYEALGNWQMIGHVAVLIIFLASFSTSTARVDIEVPADPTQTSEQGT